MSRNDQVKSFLNEMKKIVRTKKAIEGRTNKIDLTKKDSFVNYLPNNMNSFLPPL